MSLDFFKFEDIEYDIPFYNANPPLTKSKITALIIGLIITFTTPFILPTEGYQIQKALIICLATLIPILYTLKGNLSMIFRIPKLKDSIVIILGIITLLALTVFVNILLYLLGAGLTVNSSMNGNNIILIISLIIQLLGEELFKLIILALTMLVVYRLLDRKTSIIIGIIIAQFFFTLMYIPAYGFNPLQLILGVCTVWSILPIIYIQKKNIIVVYIIHLLFDLLGFLPLFITI